MYEAKNVREKEIENFVENMAHQIMNAITALQIQLDILQIKDDNSIKTTVQKARHVLTECIGRSIAYSARASWHQAKLK